MHCLVTGATGFIGSHLVRALLAHQHSVTVLLRPESDVSRIQDCLSRVSVVRGSMEDLAELKNALRERPVDAAFHLAWAGVTAEHRYSRWQITGNVIQSLELWQILHEAGCRTLISVGSQAEYGLHNQRISESTVTNPVTNYGAAKLALGVLLKQLCTNVNMRFAWLRLFSAYGPDDDERHMVPQLIRALLRGERPALTKGEQIWDYLYVQDVVGAICSLLESEASGFFNLASGSCCKLREFVEEVRDCIDPSLPLGFGEVHYADRQVMHLEADISRLQNATGWKPTVSLQEGIRRTVESYSTQRVKNGS